MQRNYLSVILGVLALVLGSVAVYAVLSGNNFILAKPEQQQTTVPDYAGQLNSLKSQIDSINNNTLPAFDSVKANIAYIDEKLSDHTSMSNNLTSIQQELVNLQNNKRHAQTDSST